jgi:hypothetical protein
LIDKIGYDFKKYLRFLTLILVPVIFCDNLVVNYFVDNKTSLELNEGGEKQEKEDTDDTKELELDDFMHLSGKSSVFLLGTLDFSKSKRIYSSRMNLEVITPPPEQV